MVVNRYRYPTTNDLWVVKEGELLPGLVPQSKKARPYACISLCLVCRRWRATVVGCGALWCNIIVTTPSWTSTLLSRTKRCSLNVACEFDKDAIVRGRQLVACMGLLEQLHRIRILRLSLMTMEDSDAGRLSDMLRSASNASSLEEIQIFHHSQTLITERDWLCPKLKTFVVNGGKGLPWGKPLPFPLQPSLTHFVWDSIWYFDAIKPSSVDLYRVLRELPRLEHLYVALAECSNRTPGPPLRVLIRDAEPIELPRLRHLRLTGSFQPCADIVNILVYPSHSCLVEVNSQIGIGIVPYSGPRLLEFLPVMEAERASMPGIQPLTSYACSGPFEVISLTTMYDPDNVVLRGWRKTHLPHALATQGEDRPLSMHDASGVNLCVPVVFFEICIRQLLVPFAMSQVQVLCLRSAWVARWSEMRSGLPVFTNVHTLLLDIINEAFFECAVFNAEQTADGQCVRHNFPSLKRLRLSRFIFEDRVQPQRMEMCNNGTFEDLVARAFAPYVPSGALDFELSVVNCPWLDKHDLVELRRVVPRVFWDGQSNESPLEPLASGMIYNVPQDANDVWSPVGDEANVDWIMD